MHILGLIFIFIIAIFIIGVSVIGGILRAIFGFGRRSRPTPHTYATSGERRQQQSSQRREKKRKYAIRKRTSTPESIRRSSRKTKENTLTLKKLINNYSSFRCKKGFHQCSTLFRKHPFDNDRFGVQCLSGIPLISTLLVFRSKY